MDNIKDKIRLVFVPYLIISSATLIAWTFLHWFLFIKYNIYQGIIMIIIPSILSLTLILIWLYRKVKLLNIKSNVLVWYLLVPCLTMGGLSLFGQQYFTLTNSKLTHLSSISQIEQNDPSKFYSLKNFYLDKKHFSLNKQFGSSGKNQQNLEMYIYITVPILNSIQDTLGSNCLGWYGVTYNETAYSFLSDHDLNELREIDINKNVYDYDENAEEVNKLVKKSLMKFNNLNINQFLYLERISKTESVFDNYILSIKNNTKYDTKSDVVLLPCKESLADRANDNLKVGLTIFGVGSLLFLVMMITPNLKSEEE